MPDGHIRSGNVSTASGQGTVVEVRLTANGRASVGQEATVGDAFFEEGMAHLIHLFLTRVYGDSG
ncbi:MAG: hypothetical protein ACWGPS_07095 [Candidatus Promineifilaceae bacterium]